MRYLPADNVDISDITNELIDAGLVIVYESDGKQYAEIPSFKNHQVINNRESDSIINPRVKVACTRVQGEGKEGREGKGREGASLTKKTTPIKTKIPKDFSISERVVSWANEKGFNNLDAHLENFILSCNAKGYTYTDWDSGFMRAITDNWAKVSNDKKLSWEERLK